MNNATLIHSLAVPIVYLACVYRSGPRFPLNAQHMLAIPLIGPLDEYAHLHVYKRETTAVPSKNTIQ